MFKKSYNQKYTNTVTGIIVCTFIGMIMFLQGMHDDLSPPFSFKLEAVRRTLLPSRILPYSTFGFGAVISDYYWIQAVQDYVQWDGKDISYLDYFKNITILDPKFEYPYLFAIWALPVKKDIVILDVVAEIVHRGIEALPDNWQIPYYLGTQYFLFTKTFDRAEKYIKLAVENKNAPPGAYLLYSSIISKNLKGYQASQELVTIIYNTTDDETLKKIAGVGLQENILSQMLEKGILAYKTTYK